MIMKVTEYEKSQSKKQIQLEETTVEDNFQNSFTLLRNNVILDRKFVA